MGRRRSRISPEYDDTPTQSTRTRPVPIAKRRQHTQRDCAERCPGATDHRVSVAYQDAGHV
jgi:hypothetical protein